MIKHHNFYKVHLPKKDYKGEDEEELLDMLMEEFYLISDGQWTKSYNSINPKTDKFEISLYPSIVCAANNLYRSENEKFQMINNFLDKSFVTYLERFDPLYKCTSFIEYHLYYFKGEKIEFYKHIKYQIISIVKKRNELKKKDFDYDNLIQILTDWVSEKMKVKEDKSSTINAENVIVNQNSRIKTQSISNNKEPKVSNWKKVNVIIAIISGIATVFGVVWGILR